MSYGKRSPNIRKSRYRKTRKDMVPRLSERDVYNLKALICNIQTAYVSWLKIESAMHSINILFGQSNHAIQQIELGADVLKAKVFER